MALFYKPLFETINPDKSFQYHMSAHAGLAITLGDDELKLTQNLADHFKSFKEVWFIGMGGSSLGGKMLSHFAQCQNSQQGRPNLRFLDCPDDESLATLCNQSVLKDVGVVAVSKSGGTLETLAILEYVTQKLADANVDITSHVVALTEESENPLRKFASENGLSIVPHNPKIGGRYTAFSVVSLLPALLAGLDITAFRQGGADTLKDFEKAPEKHPAYRYAYESVESGKPIEVMMPYGDSLRYVGPWWAQLWGESLGKDGKGALPLAAAGPMDQHSLLQYFMASGDKALYTFIYKPTQTQAKVGKMPLGSIIPAQMRGTMSSLKSAGRLVRSIELKTEDAYSLGALIMFMMMATITAGQLWGVNPFDQPAVEDSKERTRALLKPSA